MDAMGETRSLTIGGGDNMTIANQPISLPMYDVLKFIKPTPEKYFSTSR